MGNGFDKNILMVAVVGVVAVVGLFALLSGDGTTGRSVGGVTAYEDCLAQNADATNVVDICECRFPRMSSNPESSYYARRSRANNAGCPDFEAEVVAPSAPAAFVGRAGEGRQAAFGTASKSLRAFEKDLRAKAEKDGYADPDSWVRCKMNEEPGEVCDIYKTGPEQGFGGLTGNVVSIYGVCMKKELQKGTPNADLYCMCRDAKGNRDCRKYTDGTTWDRKAFDECVAPIAARDVNKERIYKSSTTTDRWGGCSRFLKEVA